MAVSIITQLPKYIFSSELQIFEYRTTSTSSSVSITSDNGTVILSGTYVPDAIGVVTLFDIHRLLDNYITECSSQFSFTIENGAPITTIVVKSSISINESAEIFLQSFFLSPLMGDKPTTLGRFEFLSFIPTEICNVTAFCTYFKDGKISEVNKSLINNVAISNSAMVMNVSADRFQDIGLGELIAYVITAGERKQSYTIIKTLPIYEPIFQFKNCFGCWEIMYLTGAKNYEPEYRRSSAYINGKYTNYDISETLKIKVSTGILTLPIISIANDLARSTSVYITDNKGNSTDEIIIVDSETKYNNEDNSLTEFTFTYRLASCISRKINTVHPPKLFDNKFDLTYE
ncbi:MAG: hypothetical protein RR061_06200 [Muribaculaceae bacterium]